LSEHENDDAVFAGAGFLGEGAQQLFEERLRYAVGDAPEAFAGRRRDEGGHIEPFEAVMAMSDRPHADRRPHPPRHRLRADTMLVGGEGLDRRAGVARRFLGDHLGEFF
jgi:hypothetical protein